MTSCEPAAHIFKLVRVSATKLEVYLAEPLLDMPDEEAERFDALRWWLDEAQRQRFPNLRRLALDVLSIPAMAADVERVFSSAALTLTDLRHRMSARTLRLFELLKSWNRSPLFGQVSATSVPRAATNYIYRLQPTRSFEVSPTKPSEPKKPPTMAPLSRLWSSRKHSKTRNLQLKKGSHSGKFQRIFYYYMLSLGLD